ncbi:MAG: metal-sulfur cluster assembly factor [Saprospirales bacterium]|jgi:metal-sulfur cluster biosynthetic enzyme|nr:metal-sulfur cluster assembly factor [Saprospirales bacterium]MBK8922958.1 metal-sulfur cluster assembly factor [Saprospirales bacterium]
MLTNNNTNCAAALAGLQNVLDPEIGLNIVDLGLVYKIDFDEPEKKVYCTMTLTTQFCPMGESITWAVMESLKTSFPGYEIVLELTFDPPWGHGMITERGRKFLNER